MINASEISPYVKLFSVVTKYLSFLKKSSATAQNCSIFLRHVQNTSITVIDASIITSVLCSSIMTKDQNISTTLRPITVGVGICNVQKYGVFLNFQKHPSQNSVFGIRDFRKIRIPDFPTVISYTVAIGDRAWTEENIRGSQISFDSPPHPPGD